MPALNPLVTGIETPPIPEAHAYTETWCKGGETNLEDLALFCPYHHALWTEGHRPKRLPDGRVITFLRART